MTEFAARPAKMPTDRLPEASPALLRDGYRFISKRCDRLRTDVFGTRLLFEKTVCMRGEAAARLFYDTERFVRAGAAPGRLQKTLLGVGGVQGLDGERHRQRKALHMSLMSPAEVRRLADLSADAWRSYAGRWEGRKEVVLFDEVNELLCAAVCRWAGVPLGRGELSHRTAQLTAIIDAPAALGPRYLRGRWSRLRADAWAAGLVKRVRRGRLRPPEGSALAKIAAYREDGAPLKAHDAAVELLNVLRPTVAVGRYVAFAALELHENPRCRELLRAGKEGYDRLFVQEVRRFYPFFPFAAARVRKTFTWRGLRFPRGRRVLLDLYGTNHDPAVWGRPDAFIPERFYEWDGSPYNFIPQGGGEHYGGHRCAGEWLTISLLETAVSFLARSLRYTVPPQDLRVSLSRLPAEPRSRFVIRDVRLN